MEWKHSLYKRYRCNHHHFIVPMQINHSHRERFTKIFLLIFYWLAAYKLINGLWLYQAAPYFFVNRFDGTTWLFMQTGIHKWLLNNKGGWLFFDIAFYAMPLCWWLVWIKNQKAGTWVAIGWLIVNWIYIQCYTLYPTNSIEAYIAWLLMPVLFATQRIRSFYFLMHALRYFFLFFFLSAAIWKIRQGGVFNPEQMSGVLLMQHKEYLVSAPESWYTNFTYWIIRHQNIGYAFYIASTLLELVFAIGFFTRKYDKWLFGCFILFLAMDYLVMRIPYFEVLPLALPLFFSKYEEPDTNV